MNLIKVTSRSTAAIIAGILFSPFALKAADFTWTSSANSSFTVGGNWLDGSSPQSTNPASTNSITTPTNFGTVNLNTSSSSSPSYLQNFTVDLGTDWSWVGQTSDRYLNITGTLSKSGAAALSFRNGATGVNLNLTINQINLSEGSLSFGGLNTALSATYLSKLNVTGGTTVGSGAVLNVDSPSATFVGITANGTLNVFEVNQGGTSGGITAASIAGSGTIQTRDAANSSGTAAVRGTLNLNGTSGSATFTGQLANASGSVAGTATTLAVGKGGAYTQVLSGNNNTYSGGTAVTAGTLLVNNTSGSGLGSGSVDVSGAGTVLGGTGIIAPNGKDISIANGTLAVGNVGDATGSGTVDLQFSNAGGPVNFNLSTDATVRLDIWSPGNSEKLIFDSGSSALTSINLNGATLRVDSTYTSWQRGDSFDLFDWGTAPTTLFSSAYVLPLLGSGLTWDTTNLYTTGVITVVPEPSTVFLVGLAGLFLLIQRRQRRLL
jgi:autotransporter-associated beta strand protein